MKAYELIRMWDRFQRDDWNFQLDSDGVIDDIRYSDDKKNRLSNRVKSAFFWLFTGGGKNFREQLGDGIGHRFGMFFHSLKRYKDRPDGFLNQGSIITFWCEDGQYIELFQPSVGQLIADFLEKSPNNPHAKKISAEIERIGNREDAHRHEHSSTN